MMARRRIEKKIMIYFCDALMNIYHNELALLEIILCKGCQNMPSQLCTDFITFDRSFIRVFMEISCVIADVLQKDRYQ